MENDNENTPSKTSKEDKAWEDLLAEHGLKNAFDNLQIAGIRSAQDLVAATEETLDGLELKIITRRKLQNCRSALAQQTKRPLPAREASAASVGTRNAEADENVFSVAHSRHYWIDLDEADWKVETLKEITEHFDLNSVIVYVNTARTARYLKDKLVGSAKTINILTGQQSDEEQQQSLAAFHASKAIRPAPVVPAEGPATLISTFDQAKRVYPVLNPRRNDPSTYPLFAIVYDIPPNAEVYNDATASPGLPRFPGRFWQRRVVINFWGKYAPEEVTRLRKELAHLHLEELPVVLDLPDMDEPEVAHGHRSAT